MKSEDDIFFNKNWIFVSYEYGGGGHRLARKICCLPGFYWYSTKGNGKNPWNVSSWRKLPDESFLKSVRKIASAHYSQMTPDGILPFDHSVGKEWIPDEDQYYNLFSSRFESSNGLEILNSKKLVYISHSIPDSILKRFPNSKIINLVDDPVKITERYMYTTALFPANFSIAFQWIPNLQETSAFKMHSENEKKFKKDYTMRDLWSISNFGTLWVDDYLGQYYQEILQRMTKNIELRKQITHSNVLTTHKSSTTLIKQFLTG
jgi:hypothetical protein